MQNVNVNLRDERLDSLKFILIMLVFLDIFFK